MKFEFEVDNICQISDGSHTFDELYYHRMVLFSVICNTYKNRAWKSWKHNDGTMYEDYFIVNIFLKKAVRWETFIRRPICGIMKTAMSKWTMPVTYRLPMRVRISI